MLSYSTIGEGVTVKQGGGGRELERRMDNAMILGFWSRRAGQPEPHLKVQPAQQQQQQLRQPCPACAWAPWEAGPLLAGCCSGPQAPAQPLPQGPSSCVWEPWEAWQPQAQQGWLQSHWLGQPCACGAWGPLGPLQPCRPAWLPGLQTGGPSCGLQLACLLSIDVSDAMHMAMRMLSEAGLIEVTGKGDSAAWRSPGTA